MPKKLTMGLIGAGRIGRIHAQHLAYRIPDVNLVAVSDIDEEAAAQLGHDFDIPAVYSDHRRILDDATIDAVAICSSTDTHAQFVIESAQAGKQIFCEKPIHLDLALIDAALAAVETADVKLMVGFNRRFDHNFRRVRELVELGKIGEPHFVRITSRDPDPPPISYIEVSGGLFLDMTIHDFDMARYLIGAEVDEIYATGGVMVDPAIGAAGDIDTALITLRYQNDVLGSIDNSRQAAYGYDQRVEVFGSEGVIVVKNDKPDRATLADSAGMHSALPLYFFVERYVEAYLAEMHEFVACVLHDRQPSVSGMDGRIAVEMGYAAKKSYEQNRPVRLSEIGA